MTVLAGSPIFVVIARTERGRQSLTPELLHPWVRPWLEVPERSAWWIEQEAGCALFNPESAINNDDASRRAALSVRGAVYAGGRQESPRAWPGLNNAVGTLSILYDLLERDSAAVRDLRGQFALACWDGRRQRLILARDHLGQRSLFLRTSNDFLIVCSDLAPLLRDPHAGCELDRESAVWYLSFGMAPPGRTLARSVDRLPAAHLLIWEPGNPPFRQRYWTPLDAASPRQATPETIDALRSALDQSIAKQVVLDGPQGIFLSGGVDSTYIAATAMGLGAPSLTAFTSGFEESAGMNEIEYAKAVSEWLGIKHEVLPLYARGGLELMEDIILPAAEPCSAWASLTHFWLLLSAREKGITRMLSGLGADEIFGGYDHFRGYYARYLRYLRRRPTPPGISDFEALLLPEDQLARRTLYPGVARFFDDPSLKRFLAEPFSEWKYASHLRSFYRECLSLKPEAQVMEMMVAHECQHRIPDLLFGGFETLSRRLGVQVAYPFLDPDLVRLVTGLEAESRYRTASGKFSLRFRALQPHFKYALMKAAEGRVPEEIRLRPRKSFTAPFGAWLFNENFARPLLARLQRSRFWELNIIKPDWLEEVFKRVRPGPNPWVFQVWAVLTLAGWYDHYVEPPPS